MPCPPSYEELEMANLDRSTSRLKKSLPILKVQSAETLAAVEILKEGSMQNNVSAKVLKDFDLVIQDIKKAAAFDLHALLARPNLSGTWPSQADLEIMEKYKDQMRKRHNELELVLCKSRQLIYQTWMILKELALPFSPDLGKILKQEKERHLQHREEDRKAAIKQLENLIRYYRVQAKLQSEGKLKGSTSDFNYHKEIETTEEKINQIKAFSDHEILSNRLLFF